MNNRWKQIVANPEVVFSRTDRGYLRKAREDVRTFPVCPVCDCAILWDGDAMRLRSNELCHASCIEPPVEPPPPWIDLSADGYIVLQPFGRNPICGECQEEMDPEDALTFWDTVLCHASCSLDDDETQRFLDGGEGSAWEVEDVSGDVYITIKGLEHGTVRMNIGPWRDVFKALVFAPEKDHDDGS